MSNINHSSSFVQFHMRSNENLLVKLPGNYSFKLVPETALLVAAYCFLLFALADVVQFLLAHRQLSTGPSGNYVILPWLRYFGTPQFFTKEYAYLDRIRKHFPGAWFRFRVRNNEVVVVNGYEARKAFFNQKGFNFLDGYLLLNPGLKYLVPGEQKEGKDGFAWFLKQFIRTDVMEHFLQPIISDGSHLVLGLGKEGLMNPYVDLDRAIFRISSRIACGNEIADDPKKLASAMHAFSWLHQSSTPRALLFPWIPTLSRFRGILGGLQLHRMSSDIYQRRKKNNKANFDVLQTLVDDGVNPMQASVLVIMTIFAAHTNTSAIFCWFYIMLCENPIWLAKVRDEVDQFVNANGAKGLTMSDMLSEIELDTWEEALPTLDLCLHECLRTIMSGTLMRRNVGNDVQIAGRNIRHGDFILYMTEDAHLDGDMYPDPTKFDPLRDQNKSSQLGFLAWGAGTHPCTGQRLARLIIKIYTAMLLYTYDFQLADAKGHKLKRSPQPIVRLFNVPKPDIDVRLRYKTRVHEKA